MLDLEIKIIMTVLTNQVLVCLIDVLDFDSDLFASNCDSDFWNILLFLKRLLTATATSLFRRIRLLAVAADFLLIVTTDLLLVVAAELFLVVTAGLLLVVTAWTLLS